jgi:hypothetical protein
MKFGDLFTQEQKEQPSGTPAFASHGLWSMAMHLGEIIDLRYGDPRYITSVLRWDVMRATWVSTYGTVLAKNARTAGLYVDVIPLGDI